jgi:hypothetical protein
MSETKETKIKEEKPVEEQQPVEEPKLPEEKPVTEEKKELPQTTLLLEEPKESPFKMLLFLAFVCLFGYFIIKMDNIYYKISFIISFMILTYFFKKHFNIFPKKIKEDDGVNLIEG